MDQQQPRQKKYCGKGRPNERWKNAWRIYISARDLETIVNNVDARGGVRIDFNEMRQPDQWGNTHTMSIDEWQPPDNGQRGAAASSGRTGGQSRPASTSRYQADDGPPRRQSQSPPPAAAWDPDDDIPF